MRRNTAIDCYRVLSIVGIVVLHVIAYTGYWSAYKNFGYLLSSCVDGFVIISGYFGVRFSARKVIYLYCTAIWSMLVAFALSILVQGLPISLSSLLKEMNVVFKQYWFLHGYVFLMCMAPIIDSALQNRGAKQQVLIFLPFVVMVFGWGAAERLPLLHHIIPSVPGLTAFSGLTLAGIYALSRFYRLHENQFDKIPKPYYCGLSILSGVIVSLGLGWFAWYNSIFTFLLAISCFHLLKSVPVLPSIARCVGVTGPSVFAIYILHANQPAYAVMRIVVEEIRRRIPDILVIVVMSIIVVLGAVIIDLVRRAIVCLIIRWIENRA